MDPIRGHVRFVDSVFSELKSRVGSRRAVIVVPAELSAMISLPSRLSEARLDIGLIEVDDGEIQKSWSTVISVVDRLGEIDFPRDGVLIGVGGGATTDLTGFIASLWMRGVPWIAVPTTLAGMVDAAIGGKTGINIVTGKNLVGAFHLPEVTLIDVSFLATLSERDINAGLAEVIKCGFISDPVILDIAESLNEDDRSNPSHSARVLSMIERSVAVKVSIVEKDYKEGDVRAFLNYGHTLGHAIEHGSEYRLRHGEAISIGMHFAAHLSARIFHLDRVVVARHISLLEKFHLPLTFVAVEFEQLWKTIIRDKKSKNDKVRFVLLRDLGIPAIVDDLPYEEAEEVFQEFISIGQKD